MIARASGRPSRAGPDQRVRGAAHRDPHRQRVLHRAGVDPDVVERRAVTAGPGDPHRLADGQQQLELLGEQLVVVVQVVAEQRKGLDERSAPGHDLRPAAGQEVERGELLEHPHGVVRAEHRHRAGQADALGARGARGQRDGRGRHREVGPVVLAEAEDVEAHLVGQLHLLEQVAHPLLGAHGLDRRRPPRRCRRRSPSGRPA